jgi:hypothetical protein
MRPSPRSRRRVFFALHQLDKGGAVPRPDNELSKVWEVLASMKRGKARRFSGELRAVMVRVSLA